MDQTAAFGFQAIDEFAIPEPIGHVRDEADDYCQADDGKDFYNPGRGFKRFREKHCGVSETGQGETTQQDQTAHFTTDSAFGLLRFCQSSWEIAKELSVSKAHQ